MIAVKDTMTTGSILKTVGGGGGGRDDQECGDHVFERRVRFDLSEEQELRADRPFCPLGKRKEKKVRRGRRKITAETWSYIRRLSEEEDCLAEKTRLKDLSINEKTGEGLDIDGNGEPGPEKGETPCPEVSLQDREQAAIVSNFMKCWGKIANMEIKTEGEGDGWMGGPKEPARKTD